MGLLSDLRGGLKGKKTDPRTIADVEAALGRLADERRAAREAISAAMKERDELLLIDGSDNEIAGLDTAADRHRLLLERADRIEPILMAELQSLREDAKRRQWSALLDRFDAAALEFARALRSAIEAYESLSKIRGEAQTSGFATESAHAMPFAPNILARDILSSFEGELDRQRDARAGAAKPPQPRVVAPAPAPAPRAAPIAAPKPAKAAPPPPAPAAKKVEPPKPNERGELRVTFLHDGFELPGREGPNRPRVGETLALPEAAAYAVVRANAAVFEEECK